MLRYQILGVVVRVAWLMSCQSDIDPDTESAIRLEPTRCDNVVQCEYIDFGGAIAPLEVGILINRPIPGSAWL